MSGQSAVGFFGLEFVQWSVVGRLVAQSAVAFHLLSNNQPWSDAFLAEWGVDFDDSGRKKDLNVIVIVVGVVVVGVFVEREAGSDAITNGTTA